MRLLRGYCHRISAVPTGAENIQKPHKMLVNCAFLVVAAMQTPHIAPLRLQRPCVRIAPGVPKCVDERCNAENAARKCGVFTYNALLLERKSCKNSIFRNFSFALREATFLRCALPNLWSGVTRTPRLKNKENQQPLYHPPLFWRVRQRLFLSDGSRTHNLKWAP